MDINQNRQALFLNSMSRVSWGAIFAGVFTAMFFQLLLGLLGLAIGLTVIDFSGDIPGKGLSIAAGIWLLISTILSIFVGSFIAGRLAGLSAKYDGLLHGVVTLAFLAILSLFLTSSGVSNLVGGIFSVGTQAARTPQVQQMIPSQSQMQQQQPQITSEQRQQMAKQAEKTATRAALWAFITGVLSLMIAMLGGYLGMQSRIAQIISETE